MSADSLPLSGDAVDWLELLAREPGFVSANVAAPCDSFLPLIWFGLVEQDGVAFRLTDLGRWALTFGVVERVG